MQSNGFAKLPRWLEDYDIFGKDAEFFRIVTVLSFLAQFTPGKIVMFHGKPRTLQIGQLAIGRVKLAASSRCPESVTKRAIEKLKRGQRIIVETDNQVSVITCTWFLNEDDERTTERPKVDNETTKSVLKSSSNRTLYSEEEREEDKNQRKKEPNLAPSGVPPSPPSAYSELVNYLIFKWPDITPLKAIELEANAKEAFPAVDLLSETRKAYAWERSESKHRKVKHAPFLNNWWSRAQQDANKNESHPVEKPDHPLIKPWWEPERRRLQLLNPEWDLSDDAVYGEAARIDALSPEEKAERARKFAAAKVRAAGHQLEQA